MPRYRVELRTITTVVVEADNPYDAAAIAAQRNDGAQVVNVRSAVGRIAGGTAAKTTAKKRRPLSAEHRAKLAANAAKARAARARNLKSTTTAGKKKAGKKKAGKKT